MADAKQGKSEEFCNGSSQTRMVLAKPRLGGFGSSSFGSGSSSIKNPNPFGSVLRPPQLKPASNPFVKPPEQETESDKVTVTSTDDRLKDKEETDTPKFVPLQSSAVTPRTVNQAPAPSLPPPSSGFVFGQNLSERVVINEVVNNGEANAVNHSATNGTSELLFTSAAASVKETSQDEPSSSDGRSADGLAAAAAEYERSHARPPPPTSNVTTTGEEDEINVLQITCRLFAWESGSWAERGRGVLRLNDASSGGGARLVARMAGSLRVALNTKLWPDMVAERAGAKSLRITAADAQQQVKLFLIMGAPADILQLYKALTSRITAIKRAASDCKQDSISEATVRLATNVSNFNNKDKTSCDASGQTQPDSTINEQNEIIRLENLDQKTEDEVESSVDDRAEENESKASKRKEPVEDETSIKRKCTDL